MIDKVLSFIRKFWKIILVVLGAIVGAIVWVLVNRDDPPTTVGDAVSVASGRIKDAIDTSDAVIESENAKIKERENVREEAVSSASRPGGLAATARKNAADSAARKKSSST